EDADLAVLVSHAIAALPEDARWIARTRWRRSIREASGGRRSHASATPLLIAQVEAALKQRKLIEVRGGSIRRRGHHFVATSAVERRALALEFCALFVKGLLDKLALVERDTGTYLRNHYLYVDPDQLPEVQRRL